MASVAVSEMAVSAASPDWLQFEAPTPGNIGVFFRSRVAEPITIQVTDATGQSQGTGTTEEFGYVGAFPQTPGRYFVQVTTASPCAPYTIGVMVDEEYWGPHDAGGDTDTDSDADVDTDTDPAVDTDADTDTL